VETAWTSLAVASLIKDACVAAPSHQVCSPLKAGA